jgi:hypothetical protein
LIATPQHLHAIHFVAAIQAGKDVYQEKTMAFTPNHARRMRDALSVSSGRVVQVGMQMNSGHGIQKVRELAASEAMGTPTLVETHHFRNRPYGGWQRQVPTDCNPANVDWAAFQGEAKAVPFDPERYINWRFYWDYSGGNAFENMFHTLAFWFGALNLSIPQTVTMTGANFFSPRMDIPDTFQVSFFDCVRSRKDPVCPFELGFRTSIACQMAVASYRRQTQVHWDPATEEII